MSLGLVACGGGGGGEDNSIGTSTPPAPDAEPVRVSVRTPAQIAQASADDYNANENGLITGATLKRWKDDWLNQRPDSINGRLIILQLTKGPDGAEYIASDGQQVFSYETTSDDWIQTRSNGVIETNSMVPDGAAMDALLRRYGIDPINDMIVIAMGTGGAGQAMRQGRVWYALRYWGVEADNLALLNGGHQWLNGSSLGAADFQAVPDLPPNNGRVSVKSLPDDNTLLQATVEDLLAVTTEGDYNDLDDGAFIWDARGLNQYSAGEMLELGQSGCEQAYCAPPPDFDYTSTFQNAGSRQGHPWGTLQLQFSHMLDPERGYAYKPKAELAAYLNGELDANGIGIIDATYQPVGVGNAYQPGDTAYVYCETTFRAMITGVVSAVILGQPTRFYDGAMVEWNSLSHLPASDGNPILPIDSPWRTDVRSFFRPALDPAAVEPRVITNAYAATTRAVVEADRAYKIGGATSGGSSGDGGSSGGGLPPNPCGG